MSAFSRASTPFDTAETPRAGDTQRHLFVCSCVPQDAGFLHMLVHHTFDSGSVVLLELSPLGRTGDVPGASFSQMHLGYLWLRELRVSEGAAPLQADDQLPI